MEKEIIGYKLKENCLQYKKAIAIICNVMTFDFDSFGKDLSNFGGGLNSLQKAGVLNLWFELVYKEEHRFKENEWLYVENKENKNIFRFNGVNRNNTITTKEFHCVKHDNSFYQSGNSNNHFYLTDAVKATPQQIQEILTIVAKHKGFVEGVKVDQRSAYNGCGGIHIIKYNKTDYGHSSDNFSIGNVGIYSDGKWVTIIKDELPIIDGNKGKIIDDYVFYGCDNQFRYTKEYLKELSLVMNQGVLDAVVVNKNIQVTKEQIEQIIKCLEK